MRKWPFLTLLLVVGLVFGQLITAPFLLYDDPQHVLNNEWLKSGAWPEFWSKPYFGLFVPVTYTIWTWLWSLWPAPWAFHALNIVLHALNAWLVYLLARRRGGGLESAAWLAALVFAHHPVQLETVAWVACGRDIISATFGLLSLLLASSVGATLTFVLACLAKPGLVVLPLALLLLKPERWRLSLLWGALTLPIIAITRWAQSGFITSHELDLSWLERPLVILDSLGFYVMKVLWPWPLIADYARTPESVLSQWPDMWTVLGCGVALGVWVWRREYRRYLTLALVFWLPTSGAVAFLAQAQSTVSLHYMYMMMLGFALLIAQARPALRFALPVLVLWSVVNVMVGRVWLSDQRLFSHILKHNPKSYLAHTNLGVMAYNEGLWSVSEQHLEAAMNLEPRLSIAPNNLAFLYWRQNRVRDILDKLAPKVNDPSFLAYNASEISLPSLQQVVARAQKTVQRFDEACVNYCAALERDKDPDLKREVQEFLELVSARYERSVLCP